MRRSLDVLRRAWQGKDRGLPSDDNPRRRLPLCGFSFAAVVMLAASALAGAPEPAGLATSRTDLTPKDLARVIAITRPTRDFSRPEQFELMQGGAGTSKKDVNKDSSSRNPRPISLSRRRAPSSSAMPSFARIGCPRPHRRRHRMGLVRCSMSGPARIAI